MGKTKVIAGSAICVLALAGLVGCGQSSAGVDDIQVKFSGYDTRGEADLVESSDYKLAAAVAKKVGYSSSDVDAVSKGNYDVLEADQTKYLQFEKYKDDTSVDVSKTSDLKNGQKIKVTVTTTLKDNPIKSGTKTIEVDGLKKVTYYTIDDVLKEKPITVTGANHMTQVNPKDIYSYKGPDLTSLVNGDKLDVSLKGDYKSSLESEGKMLEKGKGKTTYTVQGLSDTFKISNLDEVKKALNNEAEETLSTFNVELLEIFITGDVQGREMGGPEVVRGKGYTIYGVYKVTNPNTGSVSYGYSGFERVKFSGDVATINTDIDNLVKDWTTQDSPEVVEQELMSQHADLLKVE
jgi:hypothetical protein